MPKNPIRVYLADDHKVLIDGMQAVLQNEPEFQVCGYSLDGSDVIAQSLETQADILVMDINMPAKDGIEVLREYLPESHPFKIIILSSYDDLKLIREVMKMGARGYLTKQCAGENIVEALQAVWSGAEYFCPNVRDKILMSFSHGMAKPTSDTPVSSLTERELQIIKLISQEYSGKEIGVELSISPNTVETHRKNLIKKLNVKNTIGLVKFAIKNNLVN